MVYVAAGLVVIIAMVSIGTELRQLDQGRGTTSTTSCSRCYPDLPIVDMLSPALGNSSSISNQNRTIEIQVGTNKELEVDIYPRVALNLTMGFSSVLVYSTSRGTGAGPTAVFQPPQLDISGGAKGVTFMTIVVPQSAGQGTYDSVVSATDVSNSSEVWGLFFQLVVSNA